MTAPGRPSPSEPRPLDSLPPHARNDEPREFEDLIARLRTAAAAVQPGRPSVAARRALRDAVLSEQQRRSAAAAARFRPALMLAAVVGGAGLMVAAATGNTSAPGRLVVEVSRSLPALVGVSSEPETTTENARALTATATPGSTSSLAQRPAANDPSPAVDAEHDRRPESSAAEPAARPSVSPDRQGATPTPVPEKSANTAASPVKPTRPANFVSAAVSPTPTPSPTLAPLNPDPGKTSAGGNTIAGDTPALRPTDVKPKPTPTPSPSPSPSPLPPIARPPDQLNESPGGANTKPPTPTPTPTPPSDKPTLASGQSNAATTAR